MRSAEFGMGNDRKPVNEPDLKKRTKEFALRILRLVDTLPKTTAGRSLASQIVRSATSVAANYRAACRAKSTADFIARWELSKRKQTKPYSGSSYSRNPSSLPPRSS